MVTLADVLAFPDLGLTPLTDIPRGTPPRLTSRGRRPMPAAHPYIPNSAPETRAEMLASIGASSVSELLRDVPARLRLDRPLDLPPALTAEADLARHVEGLLARNRPVTGFLSFLGAGCYPHHVPAVCSEINSRAEFLTAYAGEPYEDHGKWQALFEYQSLMADLLELDVVGIPTYDGYQAAATALRMAGRITGRPRVLIAATIPAAKRAKIGDYLDGALEIGTVPAGPDGQQAPEAVAAQLSDAVAAVYLETPNLFGVVEEAAAPIAAMAHALGAIMVCGTDPVSLGFLPPPARWGADIVCGDIQSLGLGLHFGGAHGGFIAIDDDERFVFQLPSRLFGLAPTATPGQIGFADVAYERTSLARREDGVEWTGTAAALWGITAAVYLASLGPAGMAELGETVARRTRQAITALEPIGGLRVPYAASPHWREFVVRYERVTVAEVNAALLDRGILGGADLSGHPAAGGQASLFCVTERHTADDVEALATALREVLA